MTSRIYTVIWDFSWYNMSSFLRYNNEYIWIYKGDLMEEKNKKIEVEEQWDWTSFSHELQGQVRTSRTTVTRQLSAIGSSKRWTTKVLKGHPYLVSEASEAH